ERGGSALACAAGRAAGTARGAAAQAREAGGHPAPPAASSTCKSAAPCTAGRYAPCCAGGSGPGDFRAHARVNPCGAGRRVIRRESRARDSDGPAGRLSERLAVRRRAASRIARDGELRTGRPAARPRAAVRGVRAATALPLWTALWTRGPGVVFVQFSLTLVLVWMAIVSER